MSFKITTDSYDLDMEVMQNIPCPNCKRKRGLSKVTFHCATGLFGGRGEIESAEITCLKCQKRYVLAEQALMDSLVIYKRTVKGKEDEYPNPQKIMNRAKKDTLNRMEEDEMATNAEKKKESWFPIKIKIK